MIKKTLLCLALVESLLPAKAQESCSAPSPAEFKIELVRLGTDEVVDKGVKAKRVFGDIGINGHSSAAAAAPED
jgi:hypothetical protein